MPFGIFISTEREEEIPTMESREFYRNRTNFGWALGPEKVWSCLSYCSVPAPSLALSPSHSLAPFPEPTVAAVWCCGCSCCPAQEGM